MTTLSKKVRSASTIVTPVPVSVVLQNAKLACRQTIARGRRARDLRESGEHRTVNEGLAGVADCGERRLPSVAAELLQVINGLRFAKIVATDRDIDVLRKAVDEAEAF